MRLRKYEVWIVGTDDGQPFEDFKGRCYTRTGAELKIYHALYCRAALAAQAEARRVGWDLRARGEIREATA